MTSHCNTDRGARNAIEAGIGGIEHGGLLQEDTLRLMAKKGVHFTPTLTVQEVSLSITHRGVTKLNLPAHCQRTARKEDITLLAVKGKDRRGVLVPGYQEGTRTRRQHRIRNRLSGSGPTC